MGVQEQLGSVAPIEVRAAVSQVAAQRLGRVAPDRDDALLAALADASHDALLEVDAGVVEPDRLADAEAGAVEELDEGAVAQVCAG